MLISGYFRVKSFSGKDAQGYETEVDVENVMDAQITGTLYLPPYMRKSTSSISSNSVIFGVMDDVTGLGAALYSEDADFEYRFDADVTIGKNLSVQKSITASEDIKSLYGDVVAGTISLKGHVHQLVAISPADCALILASGASVTTPTPTPATLISTYTVTPS